MKSTESFIVRPKGKKYKSPKNIGGVDLQTVVSIEDAKDVSKEAIVVSLPLNYKGDINIGDEVLVHHNIFRDYYDQHGNMKHSRAYIYENNYTAIPEEIFLVKKSNYWKPNLDFCIVKPLEDDFISKLDVFLPHTGIIHLSNTHPVSLEVGFVPESEYEIYINDILYFRMRDSDICIYNRFGN